MSNNTNRHGNDGRTGTNRRRFLTGLGSAGAGALFLGAASATSQRGARVIMLRGTPEEPVSDAEIEQAGEAAHEDYVDKGNDGLGLLATSRTGDTDDVAADDESRDPAETVAYVQTVSPNGIQRGYTGKASTPEEAQSALGHAMANARYFAEQNDATIEVRTPGGQVRDRRPEDVQTTRRGAAVTSGQGLGNGPISAKHDEQSTNQLDKLQRAAQSNAERPARSSILGSASMGLLGDEGASSMAIDPSGMVKIMDHTYDDLEDPLGAYDSVVKFFIDEDSAENPGPGETYTQAFIEDYHQYPGVEKWGIDNGDLSGNYYNERTWVWHNWYDAELPADLRHWEPEDTLSGGADTTLQMGTGGVNIGWTFSTGVDYLDGSDRMENYTGFGLDVDGTLRFTDARKYTIGMDPGSIGEATFGDWGEWVYANELVWRPHFREEAFYTVDSFTDIARPSIRITT